MKDVPFLFSPAIALLFHCLSVSGNLVAQAGNCLDFDGTNDYVTLNALADDMAGATHFTIDFWAKGLAANQLPQAALVGVHTPSGGNVVVIVMGSFIAQDGAVRVFDGNVGSYMIVGPVIGDNNWHHIVYTRTGAVAELIVDGISAGTHNPVYSFLSLSDASEAAATFDLSRVPPGMYTLTLWSDEGVSAVRVRKAMMRLRVERRAVVVAP
jgi:hypothetical protein